jgi:hypothetical protein
VQDIALVALAGNRVLTAVRAGNGNLLLITWDVGDAAITRLGDSGTQAGSAQFIRATVDSFRHVVTAVQAGDGRLLLITWLVNAAGNIQRLSDSGALAGATGGHDISMAAGNVATGVRAGNGNLLVLLWKTAANGSISRLGDSGFLAGSSNLITQCEELTGAPPLVTSLRTASSSLELISWSTP